MKREHVENESGLQLPPTPVPAGVNDLIREYNAFAKKSSENVLGLASTMLKVEDLGRRDRERFFTEVKLDPKGSTARKLLAIADALPRFQPYLSVIPNTWTTIYELAKMSDDDFKTVADSGVLHPFVTLREIDEVLGRTTAKPKPQFILHVDLMRIGMPRRQAEFVRRLKVLVEEFDIEWEPMAPKREQELMRLLEDDEQQRAA